MDHAKFFDYFRANLAHSLSAQQVQGTEAVLNEFANSGYTDERLLACCLGTDWHETATRMWPIKEFGLGRGHPYGVPGHNNGQIAYGRGLVQLTWDANYEAADHKLGLNGALIANYDLALDPSIAAKILIRGSVEGWFTHFKLTDYINDTSCDWVHVRRVINGMDCAEQIAGYNRVFWHAIQAGTQM